METRQFAADHKVGLDAVQSDGIVAVMVRLFAILKDALDTVRKGRSGTSLSVKRAVETVSADADTVRQSFEIGDQLRAIIFAAIGETPNLSVLIPDVLSSISEEVRDVRRLVMAGMDIDDTDEDDVDTSEALAIANCAKELLNNYSTLMPMMGAALTDLPENMRRKNKAGEDALSLPKVPSGDTDSVGSNSAGRPVSGGKFRFTLNGESVPVSGFDRLAVFYCSTVTNRINGSDLKAEILRQTGKEWSDKGNEKFSVTVPAGTLSAELVESK